MRVLAIDPGTHQSAFVVWNTLPSGHIERCGIEPNPALLSMIKFREMNCSTGFDVVAIEMIASYGMPVGKEVFETVLFIGRLYEHCRPEPRLVYRRDVKLHHCHSARAKDANIRKALIDKYGEPGKKSSPGILYGVKSHLWSALAIATFISETAGTGARSSNVESSPRTGQEAGVPPVRASENLVTSLTS